MRIKHWLFVLMIMFASVMKADNNTFIGEHFVQDSALVLLSGAVISSQVEVLCLNAFRLPANDPVAFCQYFAPEATAFVYLAKSQWPTDTMEVWSCLNMALFAGTMVYINGSPGPPIAHVREGGGYMVYCQAMRTVANTAISYLTASKLSSLPIYLLFNGVSTGLVTGGLSSWFTYRQTLQYKPFVLIIVSVSATLISVLFYIALEDSGKIKETNIASVITRTVAVAGAGAGAAAGAGSGAGAVAGTVAGAATAAAAAASSGAVAAAGAGAVAVAAARAVAGAVTATATVTVTAAGAATGAGTFLIVATGCTTATLFQCFAAPPITRSLTMMAAAGLPLMISSWLVSLEKSVKENVTTHETMQNEFIFSLNIPEAFYPGSWTGRLNVWDWFTD